MKNPKNRLSANQADYDKFAVALSTECTGLITVPPENEDELENYLDISEFTPTKEEK